MRVFPIFPMVAILAMPLAAQRPLRKEGMLYRGPEARPAPAPPSRKAGLSAPARVSLGALTLPEAARLNFSSFPPRVGVHRAIPANAFEQATWETLPDGRRVWRLAIHSAGALGIRAHFQDFAVGGGSVWLHDGEAGSVGPYTGAGLFDDGDFWTATVDGETAILEYQPEPGDFRETPPFRLAAISHRAGQPAQSGAGHILDSRGRSPIHRLESGLLPPAIVPEDGAVYPAASCNLDVNCYSDWATTMRSVAMIAFETGEGQALCSGALVATRNNSLKPYFLTANHCVNNNDEAKSVEAYFTYQTANCGAKAPATRGPSVVGATLVVNGAFFDGDSSLLLLKSVPSNVYFAGWQPDDPPIGAPLVGIHHPLGSWKRISFGNRVKDSAIEIDGYNLRASQYLQVLWTDGLTQPGSSGSPLFTGPGVITGTLSYGYIAINFDQCELKGYPDGYGRMSSAYLYMRDYLEDLPATSVIATPGALSLAGRNGSIVGSSPQTLKLQTVSATPVTWAAVSDANWLNLSAMGGTVSASSPVTLTVKVDPKFMKQAGKYSGAITITSGVMTPLVVGVTVTMQIDASAVVATVTPDPITRNDSGVWPFRIRLQETAGVGTRLTRVRVNGQDYSGKIADWFGTDHVDASGAVEAGLNLGNVVAPTTYFFEFAGVDDSSNRTWAVNVQAKVQ